MTRHFRLGVVIIFCFVLAAESTTRTCFAEPQAPSNQKRKASTEEPQDVDTLKIDTNLVTVPIIVTDRNGLYVPDVAQWELSISEEGVDQNIAFFASISAPFHVVLMLDTSASTRDTLTPIQRAAVAFVQQLQSADRVKVISFDDDVRDLSDFTNDRKLLETVILNTEAGHGTKLYDAFEIALGSLKSINGRKAIVLFSDGVDFRSDRASFDGTLRNLDEEGVIIYPIRYDTRKETERIAREQAADQGMTLPTIDVIRSPPPGTPVPTFPNDDPSPVPARTQRTGPLGLPPAEEILRRRRRGTDPEIDRFPTDSRRPIPTGRDERRPDTTPTRRTTTRQPDNSISVMLDQLYDIADSYLDQLANRSGGLVVRADNPGMVSEAFGRIAAELRTQYLLGYYPADSPQAGQYRRIKVKTSRKNVVVRAKPGYRVQSTKSKVQP